MSQFASHCTCRQLDSIPKVGIDSEGEFKYILMIVKCMNRKHELPFAIIVRGYKRHKTHTDIFNEVNEELQPLCGDEVLGGGKITHDPVNKTINIFGESDTYGKANHALAASIIEVAIGIWMPPTTHIPAANSNKKNLKGKYLERIREPQYHRTLDQVDKPTIIKWSSRNLRNSSKVPRATQLTCGDLICDHYDYPVMLPYDTVGAYIFYGTTMEFKDLPLPRQPEKKIWGLFHEESPKYVPEFMFEAGLRLFNYSSTFSRHSDIPFPLQWLSSYDNIASKRYFIPTSKKNSLLSDISPILYLQSRCKVPSERDFYVRELMKYQSIDSFGSCVKNKEIPKTLRRKYLYRLEADDFLKFVARYKFVLALENGICDDYVTEKFWRAIRVGVVPIYFGTPTIKFWMPNKKSAILLQDYPTPKLLSDHIDKLMQDDELYEEYLEHKTKEIIRNQNILKELRARPYQSLEASSYREFQCFICDKLHNYETNPKNRLINKSHYNCPTPISVLTLKVNPTNSYVTVMNLVKPDTEKNIHFIKTFKGNHTVPTK